jgi:hypothetical protein
MISPTSAQYTPDRGHTHLDYRISEWTLTAINLWHFQTSSYALCSFNCRSSKKTAHRYALFSSFWMPWNLKPIASCFIGAHFERIALVSAEFHLMTEWYKCTMSRINLFQTGTEHLFTQLVISSESCKKVSDSSTRADILNAITVVLLRHSYIM